MLSNTARGLPRFCMTRDRPSSSIRRKSFPKLVRAFKALTTIPSFINSPVRTIKLYSSLRIAVEFLSTTWYKPKGIASFLLPVLYRSTVAILRLDWRDRPIAVPRLTAHHKLPMIARWQRGGGRCSTAVRFPMPPTPADVHRPSQQPDTSGDGARRTLSPPHFHDRHGWQSPENCRISERRFMESHANSPITKRWQ